MTACHPQPWRKMVELVSTDTDAPPELVFTIKSLIIKNQFPYFAEACGEMKHEKNGSFWHCPTLGMAPNGTSLLLQELLLSSPGCLHHRSLLTRDLPPNAKRPNHGDPPLRQPFR